MGNFPSPALSFSHSTLSVRFRLFQRLLFSLALPSTATRWQFNGRRWSEDKKKERRHKEKWNMKNTFRNHLIYKASSPVCSSSVFLLRFITFFIFFSDFAICQWNCLSTRCELKIWWWFNKTQFAPKECEAWKTELIARIVQLIKGPEFSSMCLPRRRFPCAFHHQSRCSLTQRSLS